jgi:uncharacterized protein
MKRTGFVAGAAALAFTIGGAAAPAQAETFVTIGTGGQTGVYYVVGQSICRLVNRGVDSDAKRNAIKQT